ncbi:hypothetical protein Rfer_1228 [Rhodoferax ferrireducens T118]|uniref:DUF5666 domain-containing protein n=1 Tax=Albidiferax ferrireducens (strain ATCC BAA-621 / DSM 15236 / T118) TaxID=338969 RepID=Q21Z41_ALBFT|nr:DUF5666 domain-containing protein [Rhodoferax ferrireducens]ABD68962.1 hypothetical protein Rfer_1228 [Rhodoferax ferrireducens T118]
MNQIKPSFRWTLLTLSSAMLLTACGGGGGTTPAVNNTAPAAAMYAGPITGFGSVIVNGMRFSSVGATLQDDDGQDINLDQLKLGMTVRVSGTADDSTQLGTASQLALVHGIRGAITTVNASANTLTLLGQTVNTNTATAYQGVSGLAGLTAGQSVEVYGALQADGSLLATLIQLKTTAFTTLSVNGVVGNLSATSFKVGNLTVNYSTAVVTGVLGDGKRVKIKAVASNFDAVNNVLTASTVKVEEASSVYGATVAAGAWLKIKGIADAAPINGVLKVSGTPVNMSQAAIKGNTSTITAGQLLEVKGNWDGSVLQATQIEQDGYRAGQIGGSNELYGAVSSINGSTVVVNGVSVDLSTATFGRSATLAQVAVGSYVEIKGNLSGNLLRATKVELKTNGTGSTGSSASTDGSHGNDNSNDSSHGNDNTSSDSSHSNDNNTSNDSSHGTVGDVSYEQYGQVSDFASVASFKLNGLTVDASAARFEHTNAASLANGVYVEIKGTQGSNGVFVATKVDIKNHSNHDSND